MLTDAYDGIADLLTFEDAKNQTITSTYDALGRAKTKQDPLLRTESHLYDGLDNLTSGCTTRRAAVLLSVLGITHRACNGLLVKIRSGSMAEIRTCNPVTCCDPLGNVAIPLLFPLTPPAADAGMGLLAGGMLGQIISNIINSSDARLPNNKYPEDALDSIENAQAKHKKTGARPSIENPADEFDGEWKGRREARTERN